MYEFYNFTLLNFNWDENVFRNLQALYETTNFLPGSIGENLPGFQDEYEVDNDICYVDINFQSNIVIPTDTEHFDAVVLTAYLNNEFAISLLLNTDFIAYKYSCECIYQCFLDILIYDGKDDDNNEKMFEYASSYYEYFWDEEETLDALMVLSLSQYHMDNHWGFQQLHDDVCSVAPEGWYVYSSHYDERIRAFPQEGENNPPLFVAIDIQNDPEWNDDNVWLWACDAGLPYGQDQYIVAQDLANILNVKVKAPLGMVFVCTKFRHEQPYDYWYSIVDLHDTKWENIDWYTLGKINRIRYKLFIQSHNLEKQGKAWQDYVPQQGGENAGKMAHRR